MSSQTLNGRTTSKYAGFGAVFTALIAFSMLGMSAGSARAQIVITGSEITAAQADIDAKLSDSGKTLATVKSASALALAVASAAIPGDTNNASLTPDVFAAAALSPVGSATVPTGTQKSAAPTIVFDLVNGLAGASGTTGVNVLASGTLPLASDVADVTDVVVDSGSAATLTLAQKEAVVKSALEAISDDAVTNGSSVLAVDTQISETLASDPTLESTTDLFVSKKNPDGLVALLEAAITGVDGVKDATVTKTSEVTPFIPEAAEAFVQGIVDSGTIPDGIALGTFATDILSPLSKNASAAEDISIALGSAVYSGTADPYSGTANLENIAGALLTKYPSDAAKITQGLVSNITAENFTEADRVAVLTSIAGTTPKDAVAIDEGATYLDPFFSAAFTDAVLTGIPATDAKKDAPTIATGIGNILGQDGAELAAVSGTFADLISGSLGDVGILPASSAGTYAKDLIGAAVKSKVPLFPTTGVAIDGGGGALVLVSGSAYLTDLEAIGDQLALSVVEQSGTGTAGKKGATAAAGDIGTLAKDIATFVKQNTSALTDGQFVGEALADSIAETIVEYASVDTNLTASIPSGRTTVTAEELILAAIGTDVESVSTATVKAAIKALFLTGTFTSDPGEVNVGDLTIQETAVTNL